MIARPGDRTAAVVYKRLRRRGWEVLLVDEELEIATSDSSEVEMEMERRERLAKAFALRRLPASVRAEVTAERHKVAKPWAKIKSAMKVTSSFKRKVEEKERQQQSGRDAPMSPREPARESLLRKSRASVARKSIAGPTLRKSVVENMMEMLQAPAPMEMPEAADRHPERFAKCLRLLWLWASMKSLNVVVCLLPTDDENLELCELVGDLAPMLHEAQMSTLPPPQVVLSLASADDADGLLHHLEPPPLVIPRDVTLASLLCEVLHPEAHWTGSLDEASISDEPDPVPRRGRDVEEARRGSRRKRSRPRRRSPAAA